MRRVDEESVPNQTEDRNTISQLSNIPESSDTFRDVEESQHEDFLQNKMASFETQQKKQRDKRSPTFWPQKRRPLKYLRQTRRVGHSDPLFSAEARGSAKSHRSLRPSSSLLKRSQLRLSSSHRRRFQKPKRIESIDLIIENEEESNQKDPNFDANLDIDNTKTDENEGEATFLNDIYTIEENNPSTSHVNDGVEVKNEEKFFALNDIQPAKLYEEYEDPTIPSKTEGNPIESLSPNITIQPDMAELLQIDNVTASFMSKSGDILSPTLKSSFDEKLNEIVTSPIDMQVPTLIVQTEAPTTNKTLAEKRGASVKLKNLNLNNLSAHTVNEIDNENELSIASSMEIDMSNSKPIDANDANGVNASEVTSGGKTPHSLENGYRRFSRGIFSTSTSPKAVIAQTPEMPKSNKVGDINGGATLVATTPTINLPPPILDALEKKNFFQRLGVTTIIPNQDEWDEFRRGRFKYLRSKFVVDSNEAYFYYWAAAVSTVYVYNLIVVIARSVFVDLEGRKLWLMWLFLDLASDLIYIMDMLIRSHTGFLEQGLLVRDVKRIKEIYYKSKQFKLDLLSILPVDYITLFFYRKSGLFRFNRLLKRERLIRFMEHTETRTSFPNAFRVGSVVWYIAVIIHWNACFYFLISEAIGLGSDTWVYGIRNTQSLPVGVDDTLARRYIYSFYWSTLILTTIGEVPGPQENVEFAFVTMDLMCGVLIFATIVGNVGSMISNSNQSRTEFQNRMDSIKQYMELRKVGKQLEVRVIKWFDYLWANKQSLSDQQVLQVLPSKLQAEIAMHIHFETLRKVRIFQDCEAGLLAELVLKLQLQVFSPMDYVCRKGDIGREMYIVKRGMLQVVADDGATVLATLSEGAVFGELSILNIQGSKNGNRRTANVRSVGYTDLFVLNKTDLWNALREYPEARKILIHKGRELLRKDNLLDETASEESKTAEEIADELQGSVRILQTRLARLMAEHTSSETKLRDRIEYLESKLAKYDVDDFSNPIDKEIDAEMIKHMDDQVGEAEVETERQQLLKYHRSDSDTD